MRTFITIRKKIRLLFSLPRIIYEFLCLPAKYSPIGIHRRSWKDLLKLPNTAILADMCGGDIQFQNVLLLGVSFMFVFTAFQTMGNIEQTVLKSIQTETPSFKGDGYTSLAIIYAVFSISNWLAPSIVAVIKTKCAMIFGAVLYTAFIASFLYPRTWLLYGMSGILGLGAAVLWTAQGSYLTLCSNEETMAQNAGVFWAILQSSMFIGNLFVFWQFEGKTQIDSDTRTLVFAVLTGIAIVGVVCLLFLRNPTSSVDLGRNDDREETPIVHENATSALKKSLKLFTRRNMILLAFTFFYTGIELSFFSGVYSSCIGFTNQLGEAKRLVGLCGILVGAGEVIGGALFGLLGSKINFGGRDPIVLLGFLCHTLSFYLVFINLPNDSNLGPTETFSYINPPSALVAMICAFLLGFGDSCYNTQIYSILGGLYPDESAPAFALFKFTQSAAAAASFFYSAVLPLRVQLGILQTFCVIGSFTFFIVEWETVKKQRDTVSIATESSVDGEDSEEEQKPNTQNDLMS